MGKRRLMVKNALDYRRGSSFKCCSQCKYYTTIEIRGIGGVYLGSDTRCEMIGLENSKKYRVDKGALCDAFVKNNKNYNELFGGKKDGREVLASGS